VAFGEHLGRVPVPARIAGFETSLAGVDDGGGRCGLIAVIRHARRTHAACLHGVELSGDADPDLVALMAANREWCHR
jgi:hypothetical protein